MKELLALAVALAVFLTAGRLSAQGVPTFAKEFSTEAIVTAKDGTTMDNHIYSDGVRTRIDTVVNGAQLSVILRPDQQKMYSVLEAQKMVMAMPYDAAKYKDLMEQSTGLNGKLTKIGPDFVNETDCTKYSSLSPEGHTYYVWVNDQNVPIKVQAADGTFSMLLKGYRPSLAAADIFEPPAGYQVVDMPDLPTNGVLPGNPPTQ